MIIDDFTGHEHLLDFGLINMNGRMYDPLLSSFLSPDNYMQDPTSQQGFNRYAYCMYNPLKYIDPSGERQMGWIYSTYQWEQEARTAVTKEWERVYDVCTISHNLTHSMACSIYSKGTDACGGGDGGGNHGSGGGSSSDGPTSNGNGDGCQSNANSSNSDGSPGSSENNPITEGNLAWTCYVHYMTGEREPLYVSVSILCLENLSYNDFVCDQATGNLSINLLTSDRVYPDLQTALALGKITLIPQEDGMYKVHDDTYDFNYERHPERRDNGLFYGRNLATGAAGLLHGYFYNIPIQITPALFWGGPFNIHFVGEIYIPHNP